MNTNIAMTGQAKSMSEKLFDQVSAKAAAPADPVVAAPAADGGEQPFAKLMAAGMAKLAGAKSAANTATTPTNNNNDDELAVPVQAAPTEKMPSMAALVALLMAANQGVQPQNPAPAPSVTGQPSIDVAAAGAPAEQTPSATMLVEQMMATNQNAQPQRPAAMAVVAGPAVALPVVAMMVGEITGSRSGHEAAGAASTPAAAAAAPEAADVPAAVAASTSAPQAAGLPQAVQALVPAQAPAQVAGETASAASATAAADAQQSQAAAPASPNAAAAAMVYTQQIAAHASAKAAGASADPRISPEALAQTAQESGTVIAGVRKQVEPAAEALLSGVAAGAAAPQGPHLVDVSAAPKTDTPQAADDAPLARQIGDMLATSNARGRDQVVIQLDPPELGKVRAVFQSDGDGVRCMLQVDNPHTLAQIHNETPALLARLAEGGVDVKHVEASLRETGSNSAFSTLADGSGQQSFQGQWQQQPSWRSSFAAPRGAQEAPAQTPAAPSSGDGAVNVWL